MMNILQHKDKLKLMGRTTWQQGVLYLGFSASFVEFKFRGSKVSARLVTDEYRLEEHLRAWVGVFVDGEETPSQRFPLIEQEKEYVLYESSEEKEVTIRVMKFSEAAFGTLGIASLEIDGTLLEKPGDRKHRIEFIGDSITCGYGIEGVFEQDTFTTAQENPWTAFACLCANQLEAEFQLVSWSGIGLITNWVPDTVNEPFRDRWLMPELYQYTDGELERRLKKQELEKWNNDSFSPELIIVHLGTNDASYTRTIPERQEEFSCAYLAFLKGVRLKNPNASILCVLGVMGQELCPVIEQQVRLLNDAGDKNVAALTLEMQEEEDGIGADWHPSKRTHEKIARKLVEFCRSKRWLQC